MAGGEAAPADAPATAGLESHLESHLERWSEELERGRWPGWAMDEHFVVRFVTSELKQFMGWAVGEEVDDEAAGVGRLIFDALLLPAWSATLDPSSVAAFMPRTMGYLKDEFTGDEAEVLEKIPEQFLPFFEAAPEIRSFGIICDTFNYTVAGLPDLPVEFLLFALRNSEGRFRGAICVTQTGIRPTLVSLLARGDERMYERMADLREPRRCHGAILFADLQGSGRLSRVLPTATYFAFIRSLATAVDHAVASNEGVVGKHAGDGGSGFFLVGPEGDEGRVAGAAITAGLAIKEEADRLVSELAAETGVDPQQHRMNIGLHWGGSIYMGQLVPGGRLEVTALGDSVNECARIQEAAADGGVWASKQLIEHLSPEQARDVGLDLERLVYRPVEEFPGISDKAKQDAGSIPVTKIA